MQVQTPEDMPAGVPEGIPEYVSVVAVRKMLVYMVPENITEPKTIYDNTCQSTRQLGARAHVRSTCQRCHAEQLSELTAGQMSERVAWTSPEHVPVFMKDDVSEHIPDLTGSVYQDSLSIHVPCILPNRFSGWGPLEVKSFCTQPHHLDVSIGRMISLTIS